MIINWGANATIFLRGKGVRTKKTSVASFFWLNDNDCFRDDARIAVRPPAIQENAFFMFSDHNYNLFQKIYSLLPSICFAKQTRTKPLPHNNVKVKPDSLIQPLFSSFVSVQSHSICQWRMPK